MYLHHDPNINSSEPSFPLLCSLYCFVRYFPSCKLLLLLSFQEISTLPYGTFYSAKNKIKQKPATFSIPSKHASASSTLSETLLSVQPCKGEVLMVRHSTNVSMADGNQPCLMMILDHSVSIKNPFIWGTWLYHQLLCCSSHALLMKSLSLPLYSASFESLLSIICGPIQSFRALILIFNHL